MTLAFGARVGPYEIVAALGAGGMGEVYRARDTRLVRDVALKLVSERLTRDGSAVDRFVREAHAASRLNHPHIVTIHEIGECEAGRFIAMELVEGRTLREIAAEHPSWESVVELCRQIAKALAAAHAARIVHRDVKPENVMVRSDGYVKVLDFGLARLLPAEDAVSEEVTPHATEAGTVLGTLRYMSPEQAQGQRAEGPADVFALGLVLYELATGRHPFATEGRFGVVDAIVSQSALSPSRLNPEIPPELDALILQMLEKDPRRRPTASEVDERLGLNASAKPRPPSDPRRRRSVGREEERALLRASFDSTAGGRGLLVCVSGEPGIGKTTLVEDLLFGLEDEGLSRVARGRCSERLAGTEAYLPWLEALEDALRSPSGAEMARLLKLVAPSWYAQVAPTGEDLLEPEAASQVRLKRELAAFLQEASRAKPLVVFFDDLHWSDASTVDLLSYVGTKLSSMRLLLVATYRPSELALSRHPFESLKLDLQSRELCRELALGFLSREEVAELLALELPDRSVPGELARFLHERTEGSPLFLSGLVHELRARKILDDEGLARAIPEIERGLPESVRAMIHRKIEKLTGAEEKLLQAASVQGYEFDSAVVAGALSKDAAEVEDSLVELERVHAFLRRVAERELPDGTLSLRYRFVHVLYQNALYGSIAPSRRAALSASVARMLEAHYGEARSEIASELALLFEAAREPDRAVEHFLTAARRAAQIFAHEESIALSRRALDSLHRLPESSERDRRELDVLMTLGPQLSLIQGFSSEAVEEIFNRARELSVRTEDEAQLFRALYGLCVVHMVRADKEAAHELSERLDALAERSPDPHVGLQAHHAIWTGLVAEGALETARLRLEAGWALYDREEHSPRAHSFAGHDPGVCCLAFDSLALWALGFPDRALAKSREAIALARSLSHPFSTGQAEFYAAMVHGLRGEADSAREHARETIALTRDQDFPQFLAYGNVVHGWARTELEGGDAGLAELRKGVSAARARGDRFMFPHWLALLAEASLRAGLVDEGLAATEEGLEEARRCGGCFSEAELHRLKGELLLRGEESETAEECFRKALEVAHRQSARSFALRAAVSLARWNRGQEARSVLEEIHGGFNEGLETKDLVEARTLLASP